MHSNEALCSLSSYIHQLNNTNVSIVINCNRLLNYLIMIHVIMISLQVRDRECQTGGHGQTTDQPHWGATEGCSGGCCGEFSVLTQLMMVDLDINPDRISFYPLKSSELHFRWTLFNCASAEWAWLYMWVSQRGDFM